MKRNAILLVFVLILMTAVCSLPAFASAEVIGVPPFKVLKTSSNGYGMVDNRAIEFKAVMEGGHPPYYATFRVYCNDSLVYEDAKYIPATVTFSYMPTKSGTYRMILHLKDTEDGHADKEATVPVSPKPRYEYPETWEAIIQDVALTGDWASDLIRIAKSQLGYTADGAFIYRDGVRHHYSRYGEWYGAPYSEWCVMFISFCLNYAHIPTSFIPQEGGCVALMDHYVNHSAFEPANNGYVPGQGDIIFLDYVGKGIPTHVGIVESATSSIVYTIEGNTSKGVAEKSYTLADPQIMGFGSFQKLPR